MVACDGGYDYLAFPISSVIDLWGPIMKRWIFINICTLFLLLGAEVAKGQQWIGGAGDWNNPANWNTGLPGPDSLVSILNATDSVSIPSGYIAKARGVKVAAGAQLIVDSGAGLDVTGGTLECDRGKVVNIGSITIANSFLSAIRNVNEAVFLNDAGGEISIDNAGLHGITNENDAQFTNKGSILLKNIDSHGIANDGSTSSLQDTRFVNEGTITMENAIGAHGVYNYLGYFLNTGGTISIDGSGVVSTTGRDGIRTFGAAYQFFNSGTIILGNNIGGDGVHIASYFTNFTTGRIEINSAGPPNLPNSYGAAITVMDTLVNDGSIRILNNSNGVGFLVFSDTSHIENTGDGVIRISNTLDAAGIELTGGTFLNRGQVTFDASIGKEAIKGPEVFSNEGKVWGVGTIDGNAFLNNGTVLPGFSPGIFNITDLYDHSNGVYEVEIAGNNGAGVPDGHDMISVGGPVTLGGTVNINFISPFMPSAGDSYTIMTCDPCNGTFDTVNIPLDSTIWGIDYRTNEVILNFSNSVPYFTSIPVDSAVEDQMYSYTISALDSNASDVFTIIATVLPSWLSLTDNGDGTATLAGTPLNQHVGDTIVSITVSDLLGDADVQIFTIRVINTNDAPYFTSEPVLIGKEDELFDNVITYDDPDIGDTLTIEAVNLPPGFQFIHIADQNTAVLRALPGLLAPGFYDIVLIVTDLSGATVSQVFTLEIQQGNFPPVFTSVPDTIASDDVQYNYYITYEDPDTTDVVTISVPSAFPNPQIIAIADPKLTYILRGYAVYLEPGIYEVIIILDDGQGGTAEQRYNLHVVAVNDPPLFSSVPVDTAYEDLEYVYDIVVYDPDEEDNVTITTNVLPTWLSFTDHGDGTATLSGTPANDDVGSHEVILTVTDDSSAMAQQAFTLTIVNVNDLPVFTSVPVTSVNEGALYKYNVVTNDLDSGDVAAITATGLPGWLSLTDKGDGTAVLTGTPTNGDIGIVSITLVATDLTGGMTMQAFDVEVIETNHPPVFTSNILATALEDDPYLYPIITEDLNQDDTLTITASTLPGWLTLTDNGDGTATMAGTPENEDVGLHNVVLVVTDRAGATGIQSFTIEVSNVNDPPVFSSTPVLIANRGVQYIYNILVEDPDADEVLTISITGLPGWLTFSDQGEGKANLSGVPTESDVGVHSITLTVTDAAGATDQQSFEIDVKAANHTPFITSIPVPTAEVGETYTYLLIVDDEDAGDVLTITAVTLPGWLTFTDHGDGTATITGTPAEAQLGDHQVIIDVTDAAGAKATQNFNIEVLEANEPPVFTSTPVETAKEEILYEYKIIAEDPDTDDVLTITAGQLPLWLTLTDNGDGLATLSGTPQPGDATTIQITITVTDKAGEQAVQQFTLTVNPVGFGAPSVTDISISVAEDGSRSFAAGDFTAAYTDPEGDPMQGIRIVSLPGNGKLKLNGTTITGPVDITTAQINTLEYIPDPEYNGPDGFLWNATDGTSYASGNGNVVIEVSPVDDPPENIHLSSNLAEEGQPPGLVIGTLTVIDKDSENNYTYSFAQGNSGDADAFVIEGDKLKTGVVLDYEVQNQYTILITASDGQSGDITREFIINVLESEDAFFQTGITPNGDGINDTWKIRGMDNCSDCLVEIYNRWGQKIFSSIGYEQEWDGTYNNEILPAGSYYFVVEYKNGRPPKKGAITILK